MSLNETDPLVPTITWKAPIGHLNTDLPDVSGNVPLRIKADGGDVIVKNRINERYPKHNKTNLLWYYPFDGTVNESLSTIMIENHEVDGSTMGSFAHLTKYQFARFLKPQGRNLIISGKVMMLTDTPATVKNATFAVGCGGVVASTGALSVIKTTNTLVPIANKWTNFVTVISMDDVIEHDSYHPTFRCSATGTYKLLLTDVVYSLVEKNMRDVLSDGNVIRRTDNAIAIHERSKNYFSNGDFSNGSTNWTSSTSNGYNAPVVIDVPDAPFKSKKALRTSKPSTTTDNGHWGTAYNGTRPKVLARETWCMSFKYRVLANPRADKSRPFNMGWWTNSSTLTNQNGHNLPALFDIDLGGGWRYTAVKMIFDVDFQIPATIGTNTYPPGTVVDIAEMQLERRSYPTEFIAKESASLHENQHSKFVIPHAMYKFPDNYTLISEKRFVTDGAFTKYAIRHSATDGIEFFKNGIATTEFRNKWVRIDMKEPFTKQLKEWNFVNFRDPNARRYVADPIALITGWNTNAGMDAVTESKPQTGHILRTFVLCTSQTTMTQKYSVDNFAGMRINNGTPFSLGKHLSDWNDNISVTFTLRAGWNLIEITITDADQGGSLYQQTGDLFSTHANVKYMTAELPFDVYNGYEMGFNEFTSSVVRNVGMYNGSLTYDMIKILHAEDKPKVSIPQSGKLELVVKEGVMGIPTDAVHFPLQVDGYDTTRKIMHTNTSHHPPLFFDGKFWSGPAHKNYLPRPDMDGIVMTKYNPSVNTGHTWDPNIHAEALMPNIGTLTRWSSGLNNGVPSPEKGFHAYWTKGEGYDRKYAMKLINKNGSFGLKNRWLGMSVEINTPQTHITPNADITLSWLQKVYLLETASGIEHKIDVGFHHYQTGDTVRNFFGYYAAKHITKHNEWTRESVSWRLPSNLDNTNNKRQAFYFYGDKGGDRISLLDRTMLTITPFLTPYHPTQLPASMIKFHLHRDIGMDWSKDWTIIYFKTPMGTDSNIMTGYSIESLGCHGNTVGDSYMWWGKQSGSNTLTPSGDAPVAVDPNKYFNSEHMVVLRKSGTTLRVIFKALDKSFDISFNRAANYTSANAFATQNDYDLQLGGYDNLNMSNAYYRDLIVAKRALTDTEINTIFGTRVRLKSHELHVRNSVREGF